MRILPLCLVTLVLGSTFLPLSATVAADCTMCEADACNCKATDVATPTVRRSGSWLIEETENFSICRPVGFPMKAGLGQSFEKLRHELCTNWLPKDERVAWQPKCHVVVHARIESYLKEVGAGARQTTGSSALDFDEKGVSMRRIDIRGDRADWYTEALAHELTHIILADRFTEVPIPHWADEGMAIQADTLAKRRLHGKDLKSAVANGGEFRLAELLTLESYPHPSRMGTFYGQSASLVDFLTQIGSKEQLVTFVFEATTVGYDAALRNVYAIAGVGALEQQWRRHLRTGLPPSEVISRIQPPAKPSEEDLAAADAENITAATELME